MANLLDKIASKYLEKRSRRIKLPGGIRLPIQQSDESRLAITLSAVWAAITLISGHLSSVPLNLYRRLPNGGKKKAYDNPIWTALHDEPVPGMSSVVCREALIANIEYYGVGYLQATVIDGRLHLYPFNSSHVHPNKARGVFEITDGKSPPYDVPGWEMIVFPTLTFDGVNPFHVMNARKRSMSLAISYEERAKAFNTNEAVPSGVVVWGQGYSKLSDEEKERTKKKWEELYQGVGNAGGTAFLPNGSDFKSISFNPELLQMLGSREFSNQEIARWYGVKPHKLADLSRATFSNIEHLSIEHIQDTLLPRARKIESILTISLIPESQRRDYVIEHNLDGLQRGDFETRMRGFAVGKQWGWLSTNDIRSLENMNPLPTDQGGDLYLVPLNMIPANQVGAMFNQSEGERNFKRDQNPVGITRSQITRFRAAATVRRSITNAYKQAYERTQSALTKKEIKQVREAAKRDLPMNLPGFIQFLDEFYSENEFVPEIRNAVTAVITSYAKEIEAAALEEVGAEVSEDTDITSTITSYIDNYVYNHAKSSRAQLKTVAKEASADSDRDSLTEVETRLDEWEEKRPGKFRENEPIRGEGAFAKAAWAIAGVKKMVWVTMGENCKYCNQLSGKVVGIENFFLTKGEGVQPEGLDPLIPNTNISHPGLHQGCDCSISAVIGV